MTTTTSNVDAFAHELRARLNNAVAHAETQGVDALLITPGPDLRYLTGYDAVPLERLTCLVLPVEADPLLVVPELEVAAASASIPSDLDIEIIGWSETSDPYLLVARLLNDPRVVAVDDRMWAVKALALRAAMPEVAQLAAGGVMRELRMRKSPAEVAALQAAGAAIDQVHALVGDLLRVGRTEREVARELSAAISENHERVDFVIVAGGSNAASPHHSSSDRRFEVGDSVVVDIGGTMASGYCSDSTRTYSIGAPDSEFLRDYGILQRAQELAVASARPGASCESVDAAARDVLAEAGLGDLFVHRTGHGIGLETHEEPYIVAGNPLTLEPGMAFSIEPGFYLPDRHGARLEDIVVCSGQGPIVCNSRPREIQVVETY